MGIHVLVDFGLYMLLHPVVRPTNGEDILAGAVVAAQRNEHPVSMKRMLL